MYGGMSRDMQGNEVRALLPALEVHVDPRKNHWYPMDSCQDILPGSWHSPNPWRFHFCRGPDFPVPQRSPTKKTRGRGSSARHCVPQFNGERTRRRSNWTIK